MGKIKKCSFCGKQVNKLWKSSPACCMNYICKAKMYEAKNKNKSESDTTEGKSKPKSNGKGYVRKTTGEKELFLRIYAERNGTCEVTGQQIKYDVNNFAHILSKGAYPKFRLLPENIIHVHPDVHHYYDNSDKETLLKHYPEAEVIYQKKERLKRRYYNVEGGDTDGDSQAEPSD